MKTNKKFLGIIMALGLTFSLALGASAQNENRYGSIKYSFNENSSKNSKTDVNDVIAFYIVMKKALKQVDVLDEQMKKQILNRVTLGDEKTNNLTLPATMGGRGIERDNENIGRAIEICFENEKQLNKLKEGVKKIDFKNIDITEKDFEEAKEEALQNYKESIKNMKEHLEDEKAKLKLSDENYVGRTKKVIERYESYIKDFSKLGFDKVKKSKNKLNFDNEITNIKDGDYYMR